MTTTVGNRRWTRINVDEFFVFMSHAGRWRTWELGEVVIESVTVAGEGFGEIVERYAHWGPAATVAWYMHQDAFIEAEGVPDSFEMRDKINDNATSLPAKLEERKAILNYLAQQTGLAWPEDVDGASFVY